MRVIAHMEMSHVTHMNESYHTQAPPFATSGVATISGLLQIQVSFAKEPYKRDDILQKRPGILRSLLIVATPIRAR